MQDKLLAASIAAALAAQSADAKDLLLDAPPAAIGALVGGTVGTASTSTAAVMWVADTTTDKTYPAWYGQLPLAASTVIAPEWRVARSSSAVDLSFWRPLP